MATSELENELLDDVDFILEIQRIAVINAAVDGIRYLRGISPVYTGWYAANHRVELNQSPVILSPSTRPPDSARFNPIAPSAEELVQQALPTLLKYQFTDSIVMKNTVPYADKVELGTPTVPEGLFYARAEQLINETIRVSFAKLKGTGANAVRKRNRGTARFRTTVKP